MEESATHNYTGYAGITTKSSTPIYKEQSFESIRRTIAWELCFRELCTIKVRQIFIECSVFQKHFLSLCRYRTGSRHISNVKVFRVYSHIEI